MEPRNRIDLRPLGAPRMAVASSKPWILSGLGQVKRIMFRLWRKFVSCGREEGINRALSSHSHVLVETRVSEVKAGPFLELHSIAIWSSPACRKSSSYRLSISLRVTFISLARSPPPFDRSAAMIRRKLYKTKLCTLFQRDRCPRHSCNFAHGEAEIRRFGGSFNGNC